MTNEELGRTVKQKYPQYSGMSDAQVASRVIDKYPQYASKVAPNGAIAKGRSLSAGFVKGVGQLTRAASELGLSALDQTGGRLANILTGQGNTASKSTRGGILSESAGTALQPKDRYQQIGLAAEKVAEFVAPAGAITRSTASLPFLQRTFMRTAPDLATAYLQSKGAGSSTVDTAKNVGITGTVSALGNALLPGKPVSAASQFLRTLAPGYVGDVSSGLAGYRGEDRTGAKAFILGAGTVTTGTIGAVQASPSVVRAAQDITAPKNTKLERSIVQNFEKGVKPIFPGKTTPTQRTRYNNQVVEGTKVIANNKNALSFVDSDTGEIVTGRTPQTLKEFSDSIEQVKGRVFSEYDDIATRAGQAGVKVDTLPIANELDQVINNKALQLSHPEAVRYAQEVQLRFQKAGPLDAQTAQDVIKNYNDSLQAFYRNPTPEGLTRNAVDAMMVNRIRKSLDDGIEGMTGEQYQALKNQYGSLKAIERDVMRATLRDARKNVKGLIDYTDIFSGGQVVTGILSGNPAVIASGVAQKSLAAYYKYLNSPNRAIQNMFNNVSKLQVPEGTTPLPTRKLLPAPQAGVPNTQVDVPIPLGSRTQSTIDAQETARLQAQSNQLPANTLRATNPAQSMKTNSAINGILPSKSQPQNPSSPQSTGQLFAGGAAGIELDENGKVGFSPEKALAGMAGMSAASMVRKKYGGQDLLNLKNALTVTLPQGERWSYIGKAYVPPKIRAAYQILTGKDVPNVGLTITQIAQIKAAAETVVNEQMKQIKVK